MLGPDGRGEGGRGEGTPSTRGNRSQENGKWDVPVKDLNTLLVRRPGEFSTDFFLLVVSYMRMFLDVS